MYIQTEGDQTHQARREMQDVTHRSLGFLHRENINRIKASNSFFPFMSTAQIRAAVTQFAESVEDTSKRAPCASCGRLLSITDIHAVGKSNCSLRLLGGEVDHCGRQGNTWNLCSKCLTSLPQNSMPNFSAKNLVNVTVCLHYPSILEDLTPVEE
mgnify:CR=1 FL=1